MEKMTFAALPELGESGLRQAAEVFVDSYAEFMRHLSTDRPLLIGLLERSLVGAQFYAALLDGEVAGIAACSTNRGRALAFDRGDLRRSLGAVKGTLYYAFLAREFHKPLALPDDHAYIEAVATRPAAQGKGVASGLMAYVLEQTPHRVYTLEVVNTNSRAIRLYEKLGFTLYRSQKQRLFRRQAGFDERLYMRLEVDK